MDKSTSSKKRRIVSSDEDEPNKSPRKKAAANTSKSAKTPEKKEMKTVDVFGALGSGPIKREVKQKKSKPTEKDMFNDSVADDLVLMDVDESFLDTKSTRKYSSKCEATARRKNIIIPPMSVSTEKELETKTSSSPNKATKEAKVKEEKSSPKKNDKSFKEPKSVATPKNSTVKKEKDQLNTSAKTPEQSKPSSTKKGKTPKMEEDNLDSSCK